MESSGPELATVELTASFGTCSVGGTGGRVGDGRVVVCGSDEDTGGTEGDKSGSGIGGIAGDGASLGVVSTLGAVSVLTSAG